jgi:hypothetical protein
MHLSKLLFRIALLLAPICLTGTTWLYLYPLFHGCAFPEPPPSTTSLPIPRLAPFRLLALGDPQLEGDSSLPKPGAYAFPALRFLREHLEKAESWTKRREVLGKAAERLFKSDLKKLVVGYRKRLDLWGNDYYLAHIVRSLRWWTAPSHVAVLGDLLGSQWVSDGEFERRAERYWGRVFARMERVPDDVMGHEDEEGVDGLDGKDMEKEGEEDGGKDVGEKEKRWAKTAEVLGEDETWSNRVINIVGNHDVGYAGDMSEHRIERFERAFGKAHWDITFTLSEKDSGIAPGNESIDVAPPALRLVILNSMNLDTPALSDSLQKETYDFMNHVITTARPVTDKTHATILLTHIPLHKESGTCVDSPFFDFYNSGSGIKEQNMLSEHASKIILEGIFGLNGNPEVDGQGFGRRGIIVNGHDHEGCDVIHYATRPEVLVKSSRDAMPEEEVQADLSGTLSSSEMDEFAENTTTSDVAPETDVLGPKWLAQRYPLETNELPQMREITLRSMMGDFSGYAGFLSAWYDPKAGEKGEWKIEFQTCGVGVQHWWWGVHIVDLVALALLGLGAFVMMIEQIEEWLDRDEVQTEKSGHVAREPSARLNMERRIDGIEVNGRTDTSKRKS